MTIETQYVVKHKGVEKLVTVDRKEADRYDKMLAVGDNLVAFLTEQNIEASEAVMEEIAISLAKNKDLVGKLLRGQSFDALSKESPAQTKETE
jgi:uncharacterized protein